VLWFGAYVAVSAAVSWYRRLLSAWPARSLASLRMRWLLAVLPPALVVALWSALCIGAGRDVREQGSYIVLFLMLGVAGFVPTLRALAWLGVSAVDDAIERDNVAAGFAVAGTLIASAVCYTFANLGEGSTIWTTIGPAALGFLSCNGLWALHQAISGAPEAIAIERDVSAGMRFAGMAIGSSAIVGRSLAGDYVSAAATWYDWARQGWPAVLLVLVAGMVQRVLPNRRRGQLGGLVIPILYLAFGAADVVWLGPWSSGGGG
jgi:hypothetical protein